jgi:phosphatidylserine decarboxylase
MFQQKINKDTILHYGSMLLGAAVLSFGLFNVHSQKSPVAGRVEEIVYKPCFCITGRAFHPASFPFCWT